MMKNAKKVYSAFGTGANGYRGFHYFRTMADLRAFEKAQQYLATQTKTVAKVAKEG